MERIGRTIKLAFASTLVAMLLALGLNVIYFAAAATVFGLLLRSARWNGSLLGAGE